jgi:ribosomal protein S18 acetylase RimI-like enzyme
LVVHDDESGNTVGMALGRICDHQDYVPNKSGRIDDVWIESNYRRKELGTKLVSELLKFFKLHHVVAVILKYAEGNIEAEAFWEQFGFEPVLTTATANLSKGEIWTEKQ